MAAPKTRKKAYWKLKQGRPKTSRKIIINVLEKDGPGKFEQLLKRTGLARSTFNLELKELDKEGQIEYEPFKANRGRRYGYLIKLTAVASTPVESALRHLESLVLPPQKLDIELGRKLLTDPVINAIKKIDATRFSKYFQPLMPQTFSRAKFNEFMLLTALACYYCERYRLPRLSKQVQTTGMKRALAVQSRGYTALPIVRRRDLTRQFEKLLKWIEPLKQSSTLVDALIWREIADHGVRVQYRAIESEHRAPSRKEEVK